VFPVVGGRKVEQLLDNIKALEISLSEEQIKYLDEQAPFNPCFPYDLLGSDPRWFGETQCVMQSIYLDLAWVKHTLAIPGMPRSNSDN